MSFFGKRPVARLAPTIYEPEQMYGPPPFRKRKVKLAGWSAQMYTSTRSKALSRSKMSCPLPEQRPKRRV